MARGGRSIQRRLPRTRGDRPASRGLIERGTWLNAMLRGKQPRGTDPKALVRDRGVHRCVSGHFRGPAWSPGMAPESVRQTGAVRWLGKTSLMPVRGGEVTADAVCAVGKHPLPISPCRLWFALLILCQVVRAGEGESELTRRRSQTPAGTLIDPDDSDLPGVGAGSRWGVATVP